MVKITSKSKGEIEIDSKPEAAYELLADHHKAAGYFEGVEKFEEKEEGVYHWEMEPKSAMGVTVKSRYDVKYSKIPNKEITWKSIPDSGNTDVEGRINIKKSKEGTLVTMNLEITSNLNIPRFAKAIAKSYQDKEIQKTVDSYLQKIKKAVEDG